jgi:DnaJ-class molecular chaperone
MYDLSQPNEKPGLCGKCRGTGTYRWGASVNGKSAHEGTCFSCQGTGKQSAADIKRNHTYNRYKIAAVARG